MDKVKAAWSVAAAVLSTVYGVGSRFRFTSGVLIGITADTVVRWF